MRRSSLLTRLAFALLAVLGFSAPLAAPEGDRVAQTCGGKPHEAPPLQSSAAHQRVTPALRVEAVGTSLVAKPDSAELTRRYLLHRAWLL